MKATAVEFRFRFWILVVVYTLGFVAPWDIWLHLDGAGPNAHVWARLAVMLSRGGALDPNQQGGWGPRMSITAAFNAVLVAAIVCAAVGAWLRTWGSACVGVDVMSDQQMRGDAVVADGPYRYVRNPLYLGAWFNLLALTLLMRPSGAVFALVLVVLFQVRLIFGEEDFLRGKLGEAYAAYCAKVPRLLPALRKPTSQNRDVGHPPQWGRAALAEIFMWGVAASYAVAGWRYDANLLLRCVLVSLGVSLIVKAVRMGERGRF
jgi:protein-S-isoprenylcysteine O-methyltransferase Ste14